MSRPAPALTVALLTYNRLHYFKEAIAAILGQSYRDFELLILDNCSTDGTGEYVLSLNDPRIRYVRNSAHYSTVEFNCCSAFDIALGHRVIVTHDDDIMESDMLEKQMAFLDAHPEVHLVWTRVSDIDQDGAQIAGDAGEGGNDRIFAPGDYITSFLKERLWPMPSGVMLVRKSLPRTYSVEFTLRPRPRVKAPLDAAGIADVLLPAWVNKRHSIGYIAEPLLRRRVHTNQFSHAASLSRPGVHLYRRLKKIASDIPGARPQVLHFDTFVVRFDIQEAITTHEPAVVNKRLLRRIEAVVDNLKANIEVSPEAFLAGLPIFLLHELLVPGSDFKPLATLNAQGHSSATGKLLAWARAHCATPGVSILQPLAGRRVVVFGSAFIAALLILEARKTGAQVVACVDSNTNRQGRMLLGTPIRSLDWMRDHVGPDDVIIISSERDHEHYIEAIIRQSLGHPAHILSWKDLVETSAADERLDRLSAKPDSGARSKVGAA